MSDLWSLQKMPTHTIYTSAHSQQVRAIVRALPAMFAGRAPDPLHIVHGFKIRLAVAFLMKIKQAFITKSRGGTDEAGISWPPLSKEYLAYGRRFGPGEQAALKKAAGLGQGNRHAPGGKKGLLSAAQLARWQSVFARNLKWLTPLHGEAKAKAIAAGIAWNVLKREGAKTKLEVFGNRQVEILRDTGVLFNSLSPGILAENGPDASYSPATGQVVRDEPAELIVGTTVPYAAAHHKPKRKGGVKRPLWPDPEQIPAAWLADFGRHATSGFVAAVHLLARFAARGWRP